MDNKGFFNSEAQKQRDQWLYAESYEGQSILNTSPFVLRIVNGSVSNTINNVDVGDSYTNRTTSNFGQNGEITITSLVDNTSYIEWLTQTETEPFMVGATMIISTTAGQAETPMSITHRNVNGDADVHAFTPVKDPYQQLTDRALDFKEYLFDGMTRLRIRRILPSATVIIRFYPTADYSSSRILQNGQGVNNYKLPENIKYYQA